MDNTKKEFKINILLPVNIYNEFSQLAIKKGVSKSILIREWLNDIPEVIQIDNYPNDNQKISYSFFIHTSIHEKLTKISKSMGISISILLRTVISKKISAKKIQIPKNLNIDLSKTQIFELSNKGLFSDLIHSINDRWEKCTLDELLIAARAASNMGNYTKLFEIKEYIKQNYQNSYVDSNINFFNGLINLKQYRKIVQAKSDFAKAINSLDLNIHRDFLAEIYLDIALNCYYEDKVVEAQHFVEKALEVIDIINYPSRYADAYTHLGLFLLAEQKLGEASIQFSKAEKLLNIVDNIYNKAIYYRILAIYYYTLNKHKLAQENIEKSVKFMRISGSIIGLSATFEEVGKIAFMNNRADDAYKYFSLALALEQRERPGILYSRAKIYKLFVESKHNFEKSTAQIIFEISKTNNQVQQNLNNYVINSSRYIYSNNEDERKIGLQNLKRIAVEATSATIRQAALETIQNKRFRPVW